MGSKLNNLYIFNTFLQEKNTKFGLKLLDLAEPTRSTLALPLQTDHKCIANTKQKWLKVTHVYFRKAKNYHHRLLKFLLSNSVTIYMEITFHVTS